MANLTLKTKVPAWSSTKEKTNSNSPSFLSFFNLFEFCKTKAKSVDSLRNANPVEIFDKMKIDCDTAMHVFPNTKTSKDIELSKFPVIFDLKLLSNNNAMG